MYFSKKSRALLHQLMQCGGITNCSTLLKSHLLRLRGICHLISFHWMHGLLIKKNWMQGLDVSIGILLAISNRQSHYLCDVLIPCLLKSPKFRLIRFSNVHVQVLLKSQKAICSHAWIKHADYLIFMMNFVQNLNSMTGKDVMGFRIKIENASARWNL